MLSLVIIFIAHFTFVFRCMARRTYPKLPLPRTLPILYLDLIFSM